jgi:hypothetical protein
LKAVLLSGLVFPGLGQLASGNRWRALAFSLPSLLLLAGVVRRVLSETARLLPEDEASLLDPTLPFRLAIEVQRQNAGFFLAATLALIVLWAGSVVDAWLASPRAHEAGSGKGRAS